MSLLYKPKENQITSCDIQFKKDGKIQLLFSSDCGKFGTDEILAIFNLTPKRLLEILNDEDITDDEL